MLLRQWINPSGGLFYHYLAFKYGKTLWQPFKAEIATWLNGWNPPLPHLLIVGASAGYTLDTFFLQKFHQVDVLDPDPLARKLFRLRHPRKNLTWHSQDLFGLLKGNFNLNPFKDWLHQFPNHAILFTNFLGQTPLLAPSYFQSESNRQAWKESLLTLLSKRHWASYHELYSMKLPFIPKELHSSDKVKGVLEILRREIMSKGNNNRVNISDHLTSPLFESATVRRWLWWQREPGFFHLVEGVTGQPKLN